VLRPPGHGRWAFDVVPTGDDGRSVAAGGWWRYLTCRLRSSDLAGWTRPVYAPLDGEVVAAHDGEPDRRRLVPWRDVPAGLLFAPIRHGRKVTAMAGNHVILGVDGTYVLLAHLQRGSVRVRRGDTVSAHDELGLIGASGNALGPHLHLQVMTSPDPLTARPRPFTVANYERWQDHDWHPHQGAALPAARCRLRVGIRTV
jgi:murein DD-endopeptidase MepM/ murein hydrolase activator NlpD